jgi:hypothetical protein
MTYEFVDVNVNTVPHWGLHSVNTRNDLYVFVEQHDSLSLLVQDPIKKKQMSEY